jgi:hypothetical protein
VLVDFVLGIACPCHFLSKLDPFAKPKYDLDYHWDEYSDILLKIK